MSGKIARQCPLCVFPRFLKNLSQHLLDVHKMVGEERKHWLKRARLNCAICEDGRTGTPLKQHGSEQEKIYDNVGSFIERLELEKRKKKFERKCQDAIVNVVFDLFSREYGFEMMEDNHKPQESFEEEMLLAFDRYWEPWTDCNKIENGATIDLVNVAQLVDENIKRINYEIKGVTEEEANNIINRQLKFFWTKSSGRNILKLKVTGKLLRDESKHLKRIYLDCVRGVFNSS